MSELDPLRNSLDLSRLREKILAETDIDGVGPDLREKNKQGNELILRAAKIVDTLFPIQNNKGHMLAEDPARYAAAKNTLFSVSKFLNAHYHVPQYDTLPFAVVGRCGNTYLGVGLRKDKRGPDGTDITLAKFSPPHGLSLLLPSRRACAKWFNNYQLYEQLITPEELKAASVSDGQGYRVQPDIHIAEEAVHREIVDVLDPDMYDLFCVEDRLNDLTAFMGKEEEVAAALNKAA